MRHNTDQLIEELTAVAAPVRRLAPPVTRACLWLAGAILLAAAAIWLLGAESNSSANAQPLRFSIEWAGTVLTGIAAVVAAFMLSVPGYSRWWMLLPLPPLVLWLSASGYGCYLAVLRSGAGGLAGGEPANCFFFILAASVPASGALFLALRRAALLDPLPVLALGGLGVAGLSAAVLQFFHPFAVTVLDLATHIAAVLLVMGLTVLLGRLAGTGKINTR